MKTVLVILDGLGISNELSGNAVIAANTPNLQNLWDNYPHTLIEASGEIVGLPMGQMGNSEVGHMHIGAGRKINQPLQEINSKIKDKSIFTNEVLKRAVNHTRVNNSKLHIMGLCSDGGVHSHLNHIKALCDFAQLENVEEVYLHLFTDGRDTSTTSGLTFIKDIDNHTKSIGVGQIRTIMGRYYAMDRDNKWDRTRIAYNAMTKGEGLVINDYESAITASYKNNITDEFLKPIIVGDDGNITSNDAIIFANFRPDRGTQILTLFTNCYYKKHRVTCLDNIYLATMYPISPSVNATPAFVSNRIDNTLGSYLSKLGFKQNRIAETEKFAHVTYFFDGGMNRSLNNCKHHLVPSPKVATYDLKPEMSAKEVTDAFIKNLSNNYDFTLINFANPDMVGHTGNLEATIKALEVVDECLGKIVSSIENKPISLIVTADHGNAETMIQNNQVCTTHTNNPVPFIIRKKGLTLRSGGSLIDIAPTILDLMNLESPKEMTGVSLIVKK